MEEGTIRAEEEGGGATGELVVTTSTLNKSATTVDEGARVEPARAGGALTLEAIRATS